MSVSHGTWIAGNRITNGAATDIRTACRRQEMSSLLLIFAGLLIAAVAICGTLEAKIPAPISDEARVLNLENASGPVGIELVASCGHGKKSESEKCHDRFNTRKTY